jgi:hypothetical protein
MRENRTYGSEGGESGTPDFPTPIIRSVYHRGASEFVSPDGFLRCFAAGKLFSLLLRAFLCYHTRNFGAFGERIP